MQSVRLKKPSPFPRSASRRLYPYFLSAFLLAVGICHAQDTTPPTAPEKYDVGVSAFYQVTNATNGNFIREDTTESGGGLVDFRRPYRPWLGYQANVSYTKFFEAYNKGVVKVESNVTDLSFSYLFQSPVIYGVQPYASLGGGIIVFSPINTTLINVNGTVPSHLSSELLPEFTYDFGLKMPLFSRLGLSGGLRGLKYKTPDFHQALIDTHKLRTTLQPNLGVYYRF